MEVAISNKDSIIQLQAKRIQSGDFLYDYLKKSYSNLETISTNNQMNYKAQIKITKKAKAKAYLFLALGFALSYVIYK